MKNESRREKLNMRIYLICGLLMLTWIFTQPHGVRAQGQWSTSGNGTDSYTNGNVGIGTSTPGASLEINKSQNAGTTITLNNAYNATGNNPNNAAYTGFFFKQGSDFRFFFGSNNDDNSTQNGGSGAVQLWNYVTGAPMIFGTGNVERIRIDGAGNVGVGTGSPGARFEVANTSGAYTPSNYFQITGTTANNSNYPGLSFKGGNLANEYPFVQLGNGGLALTLAGGRKSAGYPNRIQLALSTNSTGLGYAAFQLYNGTSTTDLLTVKDGGQVGIGTASPGALLNIYTPTTAGLNDMLELSDPGGLVLQAGKTSPGDHAYLDLYDAAATNKVRLTTSGDSYLNGGNVGIGKVPAANVKLDVEGNLNVSGEITGGTIVAKYQDVAEWVPSRQKLSSGTVVILDPERANQVIASTETYDTRVAGVISEQPGVLLGEGGEGKVKVATTGRVRVKVDASRAPIKIGDLLVTSNEAGVAMKSEPIVMQGRKIHAPGTIIGKALEPLEKGKGEILVLLSLQ